LRHKKEARRLCPAGGVSSGDLTDDHLDGLLVSISSSISFFCPCSRLKPETASQPDLSDVTLLFFKRSILWSF
jgi:hypothetical protein